QVEVLEEAARPGLGVVAREHAPGGVRVDGELEIAGPVAGGQDEAGAAGEVVAAAGDAGLEEVFEAGGRAPRQDDPRVHVDDARRLDVGAGEGVPGAPADLVDAEADAAIDGLEERREAGQGA